MGCVGDDRELRLEHRLEQSDKIELMVQEIGTIGLPALRCFSTVARLGGISAAATKLGIAKSGVSRHVAQLEAHFGVRLLERGGRSVKLTPAGARLELRIRSILAELDLLEDIAREETGGVAGRVSIAATPEFGGAVAKLLFPALKSEHPDLRLTMRTDYAFEDMQDPSTDIAFRIGSSHDDRLVAKKLGAFRIWPVAAPEFLRTHPVQTPDDLEHVPCLLFRGDSANGTWRLFRDEIETSVAVTGTMAVRNFTILMELAIAGHGVAFLPNFMLDSAIANGALQRCLPDYSSRALSVFLTFRPGARQVARINAVISLAEKLVPALLKDRS